nr:hypothetical protein [Tanacetum cinerariifolium]
MDFYSSTVVCGVNTPRSDEDRLELIELTVFWLPLKKLELNSIKYALTLNPNIYVSRIKQFWTTVAIKKVNDVTRLQALVDKKNVVVTKASIRDALRLDDAEAHEVKEGDADENVEDFNTGDAAEGDVSAANDEVPTVNDVTRLQALVDKKNVVVTEASIRDALHLDDAEEEAKDVSANAKADQDAEVNENANIQGRTTESQAEIYKIDIDHANKVLSMHEEESEAVELQEVVDIVTTAKIIIEAVTAASTAITAADVLIPATTTAATTTAAPTLNAAPSRRTKGNVAGFKMDYFKGIYYDDIRPIFEAKFDSNMAFLQKTKEQINEEESRALKRINESLAGKAAKRQKLDKEVKELKRHLQIVPDDDDVYTEATPLARKVPVVDYEIYNENNKPYYKIKRADSTQQLYISFLKRKYPLTKFTLNQMLNNVRLEVEEESKSLSLRAYFYILSKVEMSRDVLTVGSTMRIPLLYRGEYSQWVERFMNYLEEQTDKEVMINSIKNDKSMWSDQEKRIQKIERLARSLLIQGLPNDIYFLIDSNKIAKDLWDALTRHMLGSEYGEQDRKAAVLYEYEMFKATEGELLLDTYIRYLQVINNLKKCGYSKDN